MADHVLQIAFCKDIWEIHTGRKILGVIEAAFATKLVYGNPVLEGLASRQESEEEAIELLINAESVDAETYLLDAWTRTTNEAEHFHLENTERTVQLRILAPTSGGTTVRRHAHGGAGFIEGYLWLQFSGSPRTSLSDLLISLSDITQASYGLISRQRDIVPVLLQKGLPGIFWYTLFGPDYWLAFGNPSINTCNLHKYRRLEDGSVFLKLVSDASEMTTVKGRLRQLCVIRKIGFFWFIPKLARAKAKSVRLRNMR